MHEISLLENVLDIIQDAARKQGFHQVKKICLEIGTLSCVEPDALRFGFDVVMRDTLAENAELEIIAAKGCGYCRQCGQTVTLETLYDPCAACGSLGVVVTQGRDMKIKELMVS